MRGIQIPVAVSAFAEEIYQAPQSWAEKAYPKLLYYSKHDVGTHFAAWEQPELFVNDLRAAFKSLRSSEPLPAVSANHQRDQIGKMGPGKLRSL